MMNATRLTAILIFVGIVFLVLYQCRGNILRTKIEELYIDKQFDCGDFNELVDYLQTPEVSRKFKGFFQSGEVNKPKLVLFIEQTLKTSLPDLEDCSSNVTEKDSLAKVNLFIENSGSMDGYVNGITEYESVLADIMVDANHYYGKDKVSVGFVTDKVYPVKVRDISTFFKALSPDKAPFNLGEKSVSELNELFKIVLDSTSEKDISIFVSDCIYSLDQSSSTLEGLSFQQSLTKAVFLDKSRKAPVAAYLLQMYSSFNGNYYDRENNRIKLKEEKRPYYIWIFGNELLLRQFIAKIHPAEYKGFANNYFMSANLGEDIAFEVLASTHKIGKSRFNKRDRSRLEEVELANGVFQFSIAVDLSGYPDQLSLLDKHAYKITPGYELLAVDRIPENNQPTLIKSNEWTKIVNKNYSHLFTVKTDQRNFAEDFTLAFVNDLPKWISEYNTDDDVDMSKNMEKTFGLKYLVNGVQEAFKTLNETTENKMSINLKLNR